MEGVPIGIVSANDPWSALTINSSSIHRGANENRTTGASRYFCLLARTTNIMCGRPSTAALHSVVAVAGQFGGNVGFHPIAGLGGVG
jgi:hypothetical protein